MYSATVVAIMATLLLVNIRSLTKTRRLVIACAARQVRVPTYPQGYVPMRSIDEDTPAPGVLRRRRLPSTRPGRLYLTRIKLLTVNVFLINSGHRHHPKASRPNMKRFPK